MSRISLLLLLSALAAVFISDGAVPARAAEPSVCEREMTRAAARFNVPLGVLYAVGMTETGRKGSLQPYAMNIEGRAHFAQSPGDAVREFAAARGRGAKLIDLGCMQINHHYHGEKFASVEAMLDPGKNVDYAARFLSELREREGSWTMAVARYHAGPHNNPAQKRYVCAVIRNMVASGFGQWTPNAKAFCDA
jgi:soluble lytic murein transglycosylase-like protein